MVWCDLLVAGRREKKKGKRVASIETCAALAVFSRSALVLYVCSSCMKVCAFYARECVLVCVSLVRVRSLFLLVSSNGWQPLFSRLGKRSHSRIYLLAAGNHNVR